MRSVIVVLLLAAMNLRADGPSDNLPDKVRPVPPPGAPISASDRGELETTLSRLRGAIDETGSALPTNSALRALLPDVEIFEKAVRYAVQYDEIFNPTNEVTAAKALIEQGLQRVRQLRQGQVPWNNQTGLVVRAYVSKLDDSIQPYGLIVPVSYKEGSAHPFRLDVWFHGRDEKLTEVNFLTQRQRSYGEFTPPNTIVLHTYGRYCNGQKLAGEVDLFEALADVRKHYPIDENRIVVRGFSLGGAACWHYAVHYASLWAAAAPGAGFSETPDFLKVFQNETLQPAWYEQKLWHMYDCTDYAANLFDCPTVAYSGEIDKQKQAADMMAKALLQEGMELTHIIGPQTAHRYHPQAKEEINRRIDSIAALGRNPVPKQVRLTTWMLKYNKMFWLTVDGLEHHWEKAYANADVRDDSIVLRTENVSALTLDFPAGTCPLDSTRPPSIKINDQVITGPAMQSDRSWTTHFRKDGSKWLSGKPSESGLRKKHGLQGPIDDAFMDSFLIVRPTRPSPNAKINQWVVSELAHATNEWRRQFRGDARIKDDTAVTDKDIAAHHLVLWGDPASNTLIEKIADKLPIRWSRDQLTLEKGNFAADRHVPVLIYPNPLNPEKYVVLNSGFTFREYDYLNNARQVPKLPDYAIIDIATPPFSRFPGKIVTAGFFGENWQPTEQESLHALR